MAAWPRCCGGALTDTHPPAYYFLLHGWIRLFGSGEAAVRLSSALCAVGAAAVFFFGLKGLFSPTARAFALAISLNATFWFDQAQNARSYSLSMLISASLLVLALSARRQVAAGARFPAGPCAGLMAAGVLGSFCHSYVFLEVGLVYVFLVLTIPLDRPARLPGADGHGRHGPGLGLYAGPDACDAAGLPSHVVPQQRAVLLQPGHRRLADHLWHNRGGRLRRPGDFGLAAAGRPGPRRRTGQP